MIFLQAELPKAFFTLESLATLAGATVATVLITNVLQSITKLNPKWIGFITAMVISFIGVIFSESPEPVNYVMAFFNGFLIYASSVGGMQIIGTPVEQPDPTIHVEKPRRRFLNKWY